MDREYKHNQAILNNAATRLARAIVFLTLEVLALTVALLVTLVN